MFVSILNIILWFVAIALLVPGAAFCIQCAAALIPPRKLQQSRQRNCIRPGVTVLIPAHNEELGIASAIDSVIPQLHPLDHILVVADNCTDATADIARGLGVEVIERTDEKRRGKGFALDFGLKRLALNAPKIVVMMDADCVAAPTMLDALVQQVSSTDRPAQAVYLLDAPPNHSSKNAISSLAFLVKNMVRPRGLDRLGLPCLLTGSGMAFPWDAISHAALASGNIVEDMQLGIDLTLQKMAPRFCPGAVIRGRLPSHNDAAHLQRRRWEHGHMQTAARNIPRLLLAAIKQLRYEPLCVALDLAIPPLSLLIVIMAAATLFLWAIAALTEMPMDAPRAMALGLACVLAAVIGAWAKFGRSVAPPTALLTAPLYIIAKLPIYLGFLFRREKRWIRTRRSGELPHFDPAGPLPIVNMPPVSFHAVTEQQCVDYVIKELAHGRGGMLATPNLDHLQRCRRDPDYARLISTAQLVTADGMPLVWISRLRGTPLPERVAGSDLISSLSAAAAQNDLSIFLLGGESGSAEGAANALRQKNPKLRIADIQCPPLGFENDPQMMASLEKSLLTTRPDIVYVALGSPKQEEVIRTLRGLLPQAWWIGVGYSFSFLSGHGRRAPMWMRKSGLEWLHRLILEPRRLFRRYVIDDLPFFLHLLVESLVLRFSDSGKDSADAKSTSPKTITITTSHAHSSVAAELSDYPSPVSTILSGPCYFNRDIGPRSPARRSTHKFPLDRLRGVVLLAGAVRHNAFRAAIGRAIVDLPLEDGRSILAHWQNHVADLAKDAKLPTIQLYVTIDQSSPPIFIPPSRPGVSVSIVTDRSQYRGTGGVLRDLAEDFGDDDLLVVANAGQVLTSNLTDLVHELAATEMDVSFVSHFDGTPSGLMLVRCEALKMISPTGYIDMKEQALPSIATRFGISHVAHARPTGLLIRCFEEYMSALQWRNKQHQIDNELDGEDAGSPDSDPPRSSFSVVEPGAIVEPGAHLHDCVILRDAHVSRGAIVVRSLLCPQSSLGLNQIVIDQSVSGRAAAGVMWQS